jgi:RNA polymerase sigma-70 factor (ECF subfamily)
MEPNDFQRRLSSITTLWSVVVRAHQGETDESAKARRQLLERYMGAVYRYLLGALRDGDAADELFQEFALRFVRGDFKRADPDRGRFRDFVKSSLFYMVVNHQKRKRPLPLPEGDQVEAPVEPPGDADREFTDRWREELLSSAWSALAAFQQQSGKPYHSVLRLRAEQPGLSSSEMARELGTRLGRSFTPEALRQALHRAREKFAQLLIEEVERSLESNDQERVEQELLDLGLFSYCRGVWKQHGS